MADAKKVIWAIKSQLGVHEALGTSHSYNAIVLGDALSVIEELQAEIERLQPKWIPVSERLPELYTTVLVAVYGKRVTYCQVWLFGKEKQWTLEGVTHWMPLPEPPQEG